jgi:dienelactone hydrolase
MPKSFSKKCAAKKNWKFNIAISCILGSSLITGLCFAQEASLDRGMNEEIMMVTASPNGNVELETTIFKPPGNGPFPLVVMNHGKEPGNPKLQRRDRFMVLSREFVKRGYAVVIPMRTGFAHSKGDYQEYHCNMTSNGQMQANDLQYILNYFRTQSWVNKEQILVAGQSYGGLATMAFGTRNYPGVKGLINFAGGLKTEGGCEWQHSLVNAFSDYGMKSSVPSLWFYGENDTFFNHEIAQKMYSAYVQGGGNAKLVAYGPFKNDAHSMVGSRDGVKIWWPETEKFLQQIGMPTNVVVALPEPVSPPKSNYAAVDNVDAIPYLRDKGRAAYNAFLSKSFPRAFAVSPTGGWSWAEDGDNPMERALDNCQKNSTMPCKLYAVDDYVVWTDNISPMQQMSAQTSAGNGTAEVK